MTAKPRLLDAYCCAGGASMGYHQAGFDVVGVDIEPQKNYPFEFHQGDAIEFIHENGHEFDAIHASPPCQHDSRMSNCRPGLAETYPDLIAPTRAALEATGLPYVIENVEGSSVRPDITLCAYAMGRMLYRHRLFESNRILWAPKHQPHDIPASKAGHWRPGTIMSVSGHIAPVAHARAIMEIDWTNRHELAESIPPYYSRHIGAQLLAQLQAEAA